MMNVNYHQHLPSCELLPAFGLIHHRSIEDHKAPSYVRIRIPLLFVAGGPRQRVRASCFVVTTEVALDEVALFKGVLDWIAVVAT